MDSNNSTGYFDKVIKIQCLYRKRKAYKIAIELAKETYIQYWNETNNCPYYYNIKTDESSWTKPLFYQEINSLIIINNNETSFDKVPHSASNTLHHEYKINEIQVQDVIKKYRQGGLLTIESDSLEFQKKCHQYKSRLVRNHYKALSKAMKYWDKQILREIIQEKKLKEQKKHNHDDLNRKIMQNNIVSLLQVAIQGDLNKLRMLINEGFDVNGESAMGLTPLLGACQGGHYDIVKELLKAGANVNYINKMTGRTCLLEAVKLQHADVVKELLRYGAVLDIKDRYGKTVYSENISDITIQHLIEQASKYWSISNASLFPHAFRLIVQTFRLIQCRQRQEGVKKQVKILKKLRLFKDKMQLELRTLKINYDKNVMKSQEEVTVIKRYQSLELSDKEYENSCLQVLHKCQRVKLKCTEAKHAIFILEDFIIQKIISFCDRHWFDAPIGLYNGQHKERKGRRLKLCDLRIQPTRRYQAQQPLPMEASWQELHTALHNQISILKATESNEKFDVISGIVRDLNGASLASLSINIVEARDLPWRNCSTLEPMDPYIRVLLQPSIDADDNELLASQPAPLKQSSELPVIETEPKIADRNPVWHFECTMQSIESVKRDIIVQLVDLQSKQIGGEVRIPLRTLINQKSVDKWYEFPQTLKQRILEKEPRKVPAVIRLIMKFIHTPSIIQTRTLHDIMKKRDQMKQARHTKLFQDIKFLLDSFS